MDNDLMARRLRPPSEPLTSIPAPAPVAPVPAPAPAAPTAQVEQFEAPAPEETPAEFFAEPMAAAEPVAPADLGSPWLPSPESSESFEAVDEADVSDSSPWGPPAAEDVPWDRPADYDQPTDTAVAEQAAFGEPAWDRPGAENWTDRDPLDGLFASTDDEPDMDSQDAAPWAMPAGTQTAVANEPVVDVVTEAVAVEEPAAETDLDDAFAPVLGDLTTPMHQWPESNGHDESRNGAMAWAAMAEPMEAVAEPMEAVAEPMEAVAEPMEAVAEPMEAVAEPMEAVAEPMEAMPEAGSMADWQTPEAEPMEAMAEPMEAMAEPMEAVAEPMEAMPEAGSMADWQTPEAEEFGMPETDGATDWDAPTEASGDSAADAVEPADFSERGLGPTPSADLFAVAAVEDELEVEAEAETEAEAEAEAEPEAVAEAAAEGDVEEAYVEAWSASPEPWFDESESAAYDTEPELSAVEAEPEAPAMPEPVVATVTIPDGRQMPLVLRIELAVVDDQLRVIGPVEAEVEGVTAYRPAEEPHTPEPVWVEPAASVEREPLSADEPAQQAAWAPTEEPAQQAEWAPEEPVQQSESPSTDEPAEAAEAATPEAGIEAATDEAIPAPTAGPPPWALAAASTATADGVASPTLLPPWGPPPAARPGPAQQPLAFAPAAPAVAAPAAEPAFAPPPSVAADQPVPATAMAATAASTVATQDQGDLWFLSTEPAATEEAVVEEAEPATGPSSAMTAGLTVGMAVIVIILVLLFIQLMTSILR